MSRFLFARRRPQAKALGRELNVDPKVRTSTPSRPKAGEGIKDAPSQPKLGEVEEPPDPKVESALQQKKTK